LNAKRKEGRLPYYSYLRAGSSSMDRISENMLVKHDSNVYTPEPNNMRSSTFTTCNKAPGKQPPPQDYEKHPMCKILLLLLRGLPKLSTFASKI